MGFSKKSQLDFGLEAEAKKWVIAGISARSSLKPINTKVIGKETDDGDDDELSTTPTAKEARIPEKLSCPPAPRKLRPSKSHLNAVREYFTPPDLETVFVKKIA